MSDPTTPTVTCDLEFFNRVPIFSIPNIPGPEFHRVLGARFFAQHQKWAFPAYYPYTEDVVYDLQLVLPNLKFSPGAEQHIRDSHDLGTKLKDFSVALPPNFQFVTKPYKHQEEATKFVTQVLRTAVFYDMGLGKTKSVIDAIRVVRDKTLILAPSVGANVWLKEFSIHAQPGEFRIEVLQGSVKSKKKVIEQCGHIDILIASYDTAKKYTQEIMQYFDYSMIVADESHYMRGAKTGRTLAAIALASKAYRRVIMSGTPSLGDPRHLWGQLMFLGKHIPILDFWHFQKRFCVIQEKKHRRTGKKYHMVVGYKNLDILHDKVNRISLRKRKEDCLDLPERTVVDVEFEPSEEERKLYNALISDSSQLFDGAEITAANAGVLIQKLLQILSGFVLEGIPDSICNGCDGIKSCVELKVRPYTNRCKKFPFPFKSQAHRFDKNPKLEALSELLENIMAEPTNKCIIWGYFKEELNIIEEVLRKNEIGYVRIDGSNSTQGPQLSTKFQADPNVRVWLGQISTGVALTLTAATYMIYYNVSYDLGHYLQSIDRNYRIGQKNAVTVYRLTCQNSVLQFLYGALDQKENIAAALTEKILCVLCTKGLQCMSNGTRPFTPGCIFPNKVSRLITKPKFL